MSLAPKLYFETTDSVSRESRYFRYIVVITVVVCKCNVINLDVIEAMGTSRKQNYSTACYNTGSQLKGQHRCCTLRIVLIISTSAGRAV